MRVSVLVLTIVMGAFLYAGSAFACDSCGCSADKGAQCACGMDAADCTMCSADKKGDCCGTCSGKAGCDKANCDMANCDKAGCSAAGSCPAGGDAAMAMNTDFNCDCNKPIYECSSCFETASSKVAMHLGRVHPVPDDIKLLSRNIESFDVGYLSGNMTNIEDTFHQLIGHAGEQGLLGQTTRVYGVYHGDLYGDFDANTEYHAAFSIPSGHSPASPVMAQTVPGGEYLVVIHRGAYEELHSTYGEFLSWAAEAGIPFDARPSFEHYLSDPATTPVEDLITEVYFPVANPHAGGDQHAHGVDHAQGA